MAVLRRGTHPDVSAAGSGRGRRDACARRAETRLIITLAIQTEGFLRIRSIAEVPKLEPPVGAAASPDGISWGEIKTLYR